MMRNVQTTVMLCSPQSARSRLFSCKVHTILCFRPWNINCCWREKARECACCVTALERSPSEPRIRAQWRLFVLSGIPHARIVLLIESEEESGSADLPFYMVWHNCYCICRFLLGVFFRFLTRLHLFVLRIWRLLTSELPVWWCAWTLAAATTTSCGSPPVFAACLPARHVHICICAYLDFNGVNPSRMQRFLKILCDFVACIVM